MIDVPLLDCEQVTWAGAVSLAEDDGTPRGVVPWRLPYHQRAWFEPGLIEKAREAAGVRLRFRTASPTLSLRFEPVAQPNDELWRFDLVIDGRTHACMSHPCRHGTLGFADWAPGEHEFELWLPQFGACRVLGLQIEPGHRCVAAPDPRPRWACYGSSITQCRHASGPTTTWPALVAQRFGLNLTCLGFGGQCKLDPPVARAIRDLPADYLSVCLGINVHGGDLTPRTFRPAAIGVLQTIRDGHPTTPLACVSPIFCGPRETAGQFPLAAVRDTLRSIVELFQQHGDSHIHYISGLDVFGPDLAAHLPDQLHPDARGYELLAEGYARTVMPALGLRARGEG